MSNESSRRIVIRHTANEVIHVEADRQGRGKIVAYMSPADAEKLDIFNVGVSWQSLQRLQQMASCDIFHWELTDHSLRVRGKLTQWRLAFSNHRTGASCEVSLSEEETTTLKEVLFRDIEGMAQPDEV